MKKIRTYNFYLKAIVLLLFSSYVWTYLVLDFNNLQNAKIEVCKSESNEVSEDNFEEKTNDDKIVYDLSIINVNISKSLVYLHLVCDLNPIFLETITPPPDNFQS